MSDHRYDIAVIGGGIVGTATAYRISQKYPRYRVAVIEKEPALAVHQTGHNSGVIHSGIYYRPDSLKARNCIAGAAELFAFCDENGIRYERCGKVIVATSEEEIPRLEELHRRGTANGVRGLEMCDPARLREIEPAAAGIRALHSPAAAIVDYREVTAAYARRLRAAGAEILLGARVLGMTRHQGAIQLDTTQGSVETRYLVNCAGLYSDVIARMSGADPKLRIIPFRGEYYLLEPPARPLVRGLIYPVPDPRYPFLGVHFTRSVHGSVEAGPNAVLALAREGYTKTKVDVSDCFTLLGYGGFWKMARTHWRTGLHEVRRSLSKGVFTRSLQRLVPAISELDLGPGGAGVRAQAVDENGRLLDDFRVVETPQAIHVLNAPSPGATASLAIGAGILSMMETSFGLAAPDRAALRRAGS